MSFRPPSADKLRGLPGVDRLAWRSQGIQEDVIPAKAGIQSNFLS